MPGGEGPKMINQYFNVYALRRVCVLLDTPLLTVQIVCAVVLFVNMIVINVEKSLNLFPNF